MLRGCGASGDGVAVSVKLSGVVEGDRVGGGVGTAGFDGVGIFGGIDVEGMEELV